ncbi:MAG: cytochrome b/b6 domain-containing protein [Gemmatimonadota bacterium]
MKPLVCLMAALALGLLPSFGEAQAPIPSEARIHPAIFLLDSRGENVLQSGGPVSPLATCGDCHDTEYIRAHSLHSDPGLMASAPPAWAVSSRPWEPAVSPGAEMNCFLCHTPGPANDMRLEAHGRGNGDWAATATLAGSGIVIGEPGSWRLNSHAFDREGRVLNTLLNLQRPSSSNCAQCHGVAHDHLGEPVVLGGIQSGSLMTITRGEVFSPQRISESGVNLVGKERLDRPWDAHAERLLECANCHFSINNPVFRRESKETQPEGLIFDSRRMPLGAYLQRPNHNFAGQTRVNSRSRGAAALGCESCHDPEPTHRWLPYAKRHTDALACEVCHSPALHAVAVESVDWTTLDESGDPRVTWRGCAAGCETAATDLVRGIEPAILTREGPDGRSQLAPYNLVTSWYWKDASENAVPLEIVRQADPGSDSETVARRLEALGVEDPSIVGEIKPYPIHHGVVGEGWAIRDCNTCHGEDSRLDQVVVLADRLPGGVVPTLIQEGGEALMGSVVVDGGGRVLYRSRTSEAGLYVLGHDSAWWANILGILAILGTVLGVTVHGGIRWWTSRRRGVERPGQDGHAVYMYTAYERIWHWLQALAIFLLLLTGLEIHLAAPGLMSFGLAVRLHNILGFVVVANAVFAAFFHLASGQIQQYLPRPQGFFDQAITQARFYLAGIFRGEPHPFEKSPEQKLNPLQQMTYLGILNLLLPLQMVTGVLIWGVQRWPILERMGGGLTFLAPLHALGAWLFASFLLMHVYLTTTGPTPTANIKAMAGGWEAVETPEGSSSAS